MMGVREIGKMSEVRRMGDGLGNVLSVSVPNPGDCCGIDVGENASVLKIESGGADRVGQVQR